jgi:hypothetical protein
MPGNAIIDGLTCRPIIQYRKGRPTLNLKGQPVPEIEHPPEGYVLFRHTPGQNDIRVTYPDGQSELLYHGPDVIRILASRGIPEHKIERAIDYLWNFYSVYVDCEESTPHAPAIPEDFLP